MTHIQLGLVDYFPKTRDDTDEGRLLRAGPGFALNVLENQVVLRRPGFEKKILFSVSKDIKKIRDAPHYLAVLTQDHRLVLIDLDSGNESSVTGRVMDFGMTADNKVIYCDDDSKLYRYDCRTGETDVRNSLEEEKI
ncbi:hypothetical protein Ciccas_010035, partial [Cichlidogyrus casuarinus]